MDDEQNVIRNWEGTADTEVLPAEVTAQIRQTAERMCRFFKNCGFDSNTLAGILTGTVLEANKHYSEKAAPYADFLGGVLVNKCLEILQEIRDKAQHGDEHPPFTETLFGRWLQVEMKAHEAAAARAENCPGDAEYDPDKPFDYDGYAVSPHIREVLAGLDDVERKICELLIAGKTLNAICKALGLKKTNFYQRTWPRLRARLAKQLSPLRNKKD